MQADKPLLKERGQRMLDFSLHGLRHCRDVILLIQEMCNDPIQILTFGTKNLYLREHFDESLKALKFHTYKNRK